jgi:hypothetical protein
MVKAKQGNLPLAIYKDLIDDMAKSRKVYRKIVEENKKLGIPTSFSLYGRIYHLMPDGRIILKQSSKKRK